MSIVKQRIASIIEKHVGERNAISSKEIASIIGISDADGNPVTRKMIREIISDLGLPIGACGKGYFLISDDMELARYYSALQDRAIEILNRAQSVRKSYFGWK